ncbi:MFS transporter [Amycolatopsis suaedae]|uniref:Multidrug efflux pump Tap n=1 Tax=Amycolatopsis suaedae TaxID=2510978 RepID=A0A4Q7J1C1_9PSEU|nr:MFS transporter [Amycolatopsis suaedae]RZQ60627.1 MFS transporter [Amycolatopsis suaedae]
MTDHESGWRRQLPVIGLLGATGLSVTGNGIVNLAIPWLVLERTGSAALAGLIAAATLGPMALSSLLGGALIDRWGRRRLSIGADILSGLAVAALPLLDRTLGLTGVTIAVLVALGAVFDGPGMAARESLRPDVARTSRTPLERINAWGEALDGIGNIAAPGIGGVLIALVGASNTLWVTVAMFAGAVLLTTFTIPADVRGTEPPQRYVHAVLEGLRFVWRTPVLRGTGLTAMVLVMFLAPIPIVLTVVLQRAGQPEQLGLVTAMFAVGGVAGAVVYGIVAHRLPRRPVLLWGLTFCSLGIAAFGLFDSVLGMTVLATLVGVAAAPVNPITAVVMQEQTPERLRGRVIGSVGSMALLAGPLGTTAAGLLVENLGVAQTWLVVGAGCLLSAGYAALAPGMRDLSAPLARQMP